MKADEVMIGDWVMCEGKAEKIRSIGEAGITLQGYYDKAALFKTDYKKVLEDYFKIKLP